jgi:hypothetical protein
MTATETAAALGFAMSRPFRGRPPPENEKRGPDKEITRLEKTNSSTWLRNRRQSSRSRPTPRVLRLSNYLVAPRRPR